MQYDAREFGRLRNPVLLISGVAWVCLWAGMHFSFGMEASSHAGHEIHSSHASASSLFPMRLASWALDWFLMVMAMMTPTLIIPLWSIRVRSFARRWLRSSAVFVIGYTAVWMIVGAVVLAAQRSVQLSGMQSLWPAVTLGLTALVWQISPAKQRCLNRCHAHGSLAAFGASADVDAFRFGISHGMWCVGSCWALMIFPMLLPWGVMAAMAAVAVLVFAERLERPAPPCWRFRGLGKATRIAVAHIRWCLHRSPIEVGSISG